MRPFSELPEESQVEIREFEAYLKAGGKRVYGSITDWRASSAYAAYQKSLTAPVVPGLEEGPMDGETMQSMTLARVCAIAAKAHEQTPDDREWIEQNLLSQLRELHMAGPPRSVNRSEDALSGMLQELVELAAGEAIATEQDTGDGNTEFAEKQRIAKQHEIEKWVAERVSAARSGCASPNGETL